MIDVHAVGHVHAVLGGRERAGKLQFAGPFALGSAVLADERAVLERDGHGRQWIAGLEHVQQLPRMIDLDEMAKAVVRLVDDFPARQVIDLKALLSHGAGRGPERQCPREPEPAHRRRRAAHSTVLSQRQLDPRVAQLTAPTASPRSP